MIRRIKILFAFLFISVSLSAQINVDKIMAVGRNAMYFEDYVLSIQYFNQAIKSKPFLPDPYFFRGVAKVYLEDYKGAISDCSIAIEKNPFMIRAYICRSFAKIKLKDYEGAIEDCQKGLKYEETNTALRQNIIIASMQAKKYEQAGISLAHYIKQNPTEMFGYMSRGELSILEGDTIRAVDDYSRAISVDRYYSPAYAGRAYSYLLIKKYENALQDLDEAIRLDPDNPGYYINRGLARYNTNDLKGTLADFDHVIVIDPGNKLAYLNRGIIRSQVGDLNRAVSDFDKVLLLDPSNDIALYNRAVLNTKIGDYSKAERDYSAIIDAYPDFFPAYLQRSEIKRKLGNNKGADRDYFAAVNIEEKLKKEKADRRRHPEKYVKSDSIKEETKNKEEKLRKYNKTVISKVNDDSKKYNNPMRGKVQNRSVNLVNEGIYYITYYKKLRPGPERVVMDISKYLNLFNKAGISKLSKLYIINQEKSLTTAQADFRFNSINDFSERMVGNNTSPYLFFARSLDYDLVQDISSAMEDINRAIDLDSSFLLAYFERANLKYKKLSVETSMVNSSNNDKNPDVSGENILYGNINLNTEDIIRDYKKVLELDPLFIYAAYNIGNVLSRNRDYRNAIIYYTKALKVNSEFADAWYNRGISYISLGDRLHGLSDLRMAGQLGMYKAYSLIKRFDDN